VPDLRRSGSKLQVKLSVPVCGGRCGLRGGRTSMSSTRPERRPLGGRRPARLPKECVSRGRPHEERKSAPLVKLSFPSRWLARLADGVVLHRPRARPVEERVPYPCPNIAVGMLRRGWRAASCPACVERLSLPRGRRRLLPAGAHRKAGFGGWCVGAPVHKAAVSSNVPQFRGCCN
jgi:hypothetical protein